MQKEDYAWVKEHLEYSDEEMDLFLANPRNRELLEMAPAMLSRKFVIRVVESRGCFSRHLKGQEIILDGAGNLLADQAPKQTCLYLLQAVTAGVFAAQELAMAGVDPNNMRFRRMGCFDVGLRCGGVGHVVVELETREA